MAAPTGKAERMAVYWPPVPKTLRAPMLPKRTAAVKYVFTPGQVNLSFWSLEFGVRVLVEARSGGIVLAYVSQMLSMLRIWKFMTPVATKADTSVATACAQKVVRWGILT